MVNTTAVYARIDTELKENAEGILAQLGITPSSAIQMLYSQIILNRGMPFEAKLPVNKPLSVGSMSKEKFKEELLKGISSAKEGVLFSADDVDKYLSEEFGI